MLTYNKSARMPRGVLLLRFKDRINCVFESAPVRLKPP